MPLVTPQTGSGQKVASVYAEIGADTTKFVKGATSVRSGLGDLAGAVGIVTSAFEIAKGTFDFSAEGAKLTRLADAGEEVARQFGGNMDLIIQKVKEASLGTVSEMDIISGANRAMMLGLGADADQLANLMEVAALRGRAMGLDTTKAFNDIVTGVGRASPLILDNLGIVVNAKETYSKYAENIGKSASELTKAEKTQALLNAVLDEGNKMLKEAGGLALDNAAKVEKMNASWKNFTDNRKRENADLAGNFADAASKAIDGWDEFFKFMDNHGEIVKRAQQLRDNLDPGGKWQDFYETARVEWASQQQAIADVNTELQNNADLAAIAAEELTALSEANQKLIDGAIEITKKNESYQESQQGILDKIAETKSEGEKLYPWEAEKIQENKDKLAELGDQYLENQEKFRKSQEERLAMMAIEKIAMSDGVAGFSDAEFQKAQAILLTQDVATAAAFEEQQAMEKLTSAVADGQISVEDYARIWDEASSDGVISIQEVTDAINAVPEQKTVTFDIITNGAPPNLDTSTAAATAPKGTHRKASGGQVWAGQSYMVGEQGMEIFTPNQNGMITPHSKAVSQKQAKNDNSDIIAALWATKTDETRLAMVISQEVLRAIR